MLRKQQVVSVTLDIEVLPVHYVNVLLDLIRWVALVMSRVVIVLGEDYVTMERGYVSASQGFMEYIANIV